MKKKKLRSSTTFLYIKRVYQDACQHGCKKNRLKVSSIVYMEIFFFFVHLHSLVNFSWIDLKLGDKIFKILYYNNIKKPQIDFLKILAATNPLKIIDVSVQREFKKCKRFYVTA